MTFNTEIKEDSRKIRMYFFNKEITDNSEMASKGQFSVSDSSLKQEID